MNKEWVPTIMHQTGLKQTLALVGALVLRVGHPIEGQAQSSSDLNSFDGFTGMSNPCKCEDTGVPWKLEGNVNSGDYKIAHISDVDKVADLNRFHHILRNDHSTRVLPAEWQKANIQFNQIDVGACASNMFDTDSPWAKDSDAPVRYGPTRQYIEPAEVYVRKFSRTESVATVPLSSQIYAKLKPGGTAITLDFRFLSYARNDVYYYKFQNHGSTDIVFKIPELNSVLKTQGIKPTAEWPVAGEGFLAPFKKGATCTLAIPAALRRAANRCLTVSLALHDEGRTPLGKGQLSLYLPAP